MTPQEPYIHAKNIIKGRWLEAEDIIKNDPWSAYSYAKYGLLIVMPYMHNSMLCHALKYNENEGVKEYFDLIKNKVEC